MNYYFLLEDSKSFIKILKKWLEYLEFPCTRVADIKDVENNNYVLQSGHGVTQLVTQALFDTIDTIEHNPQKIDKLVIVLDAENETVDSRKQQVICKIAEKYDIEELDFEINIFVCNCCTETWLLGKENMYPLPHEAESDSKNYHYFIKHFKDHYYHYNVEHNDPELMSSPIGRGENKPQYHFRYFHDLCLYNNLTKKETLKYTKSKPQIAMDKSFFDSLMERIYSTEHLKSLRKFIDFLKDTGRYT